MNKRFLNLIKILWAFAFLVGTIALILKFSTGERLSGYGSYVPWGLWVALYFHLVGIAGGVFAIGTIGYVMNINGFRESIRVIIIVSAISVAMGLFSIWLDLGQPFRFFRILYAPDFGSMLAFNAWMYMAFLGLIGLAFFLSLKKANQDDLNDKSRWLFPVLCLAAFFSIAFPSQSGAFFGVVDAKPFWSSPLLPILFLISAITAGSAVLLLVYTFIYNGKYRISDNPFRMLKITIITGLILYIISEFAEYSLVFWSPNSHIKEAAELILFGPFWWVFWIVHIGGIIISFLLLLRGKSITAIGTGAFIVAVTFISARLNILIPGQAVEELKGLKDAFHHQRLNFEYHATTNEYLVAVFIGSLSVLLVYVGLKMLNRFTSIRIGKDY